MPDSTFIAVTREGIGGVESRVWVNVDAIAFIEALEPNAAKTRAGATLHLRGIEDLTTMHVKDAVADLLKQLPVATDAPPPKQRRASA